MIEVTKGTAHVEPPTRGVLVTGISASAPFFFAEDSSIDEHRRGSAAWVVPDGDDRFVLAQWGRRADFIEACEKLRRL